MRPIRTPQLADEVDVDVTQLQRAVQPIQLTEPMPHFLGPWWGEGAGKVVFSTDLSIAGGGECVVTVGVTMRQRQLSNMFTT